MLMFCQDKYYCGHDHLNYAANIQVTITKFKFIYKKYWKFKFTFKFKYASKLLFGQ